MAQRQTLPVLPLRGTVIFPGLTAPIAAGRPGTLRAIESALRGERVVFAVAQRDTTDEPTPDILYQMGVIARIGQIQRGLGGVQLLLQGEMRATALQYTTTEGFMSAVVMPVDEMKPVSENDPGFIALHKEIREREPGRLDRSGRESMEAQVIRTYLEWISELPWNTRSDDILDLSNAQKVMDEDHYGLPDVKDRVLEFLAVRQLRAQKMEEELKKTGELSIDKLRATKEDATPGLHLGRDEKKPITDT